MDTKGFHDGEDDGWPCRLFADHGAYLSTSAIAEEWRERQRHAGDIEADPGELDTDITIDGPVQAKLFLPRWIPFLECNGDVFWALDFAPADGGTRGQVIEVDWEGRSWRVVADSFYQFLEDYVIELEQGEYDEVIAAAGHNRTASSVNGAAGQFRLMTAAVVILAGLYLVNGSGTLQSVFGVLALVWGGLILGRWWQDRKNE